MIDFSLYCDLHNAFFTSNNVLYSMIIENQYDDNAIITLLQQCDKATIISLIDYFDANSPIQYLLKNRLNELKENEEKFNIEEDFNNRKRQHKSFYQYLVNIMSRKGFSSDSDFYNSISMSRQTFARIRKTDFISRNNALLMSVGLGLTYLEAEDFLKNAGYAFRKSDLRESLIAYVMRNMKYTLYSMEEILYTFGEKSLIGDN